MKKDLDTTYYRFQSEVRAFLSKLLKNPVDAQPSKYLKDRDFTRKKLIDELLKRDVIERHEKILDPTNSDEKEAKYVVKFKVHKKDFEKRIHRIYIKYFEKNEPEKKVNEEAELRSCANTIGVVGGGKPGETADRWAKYVNDNKNGFKRQVFSSENDMKEKILNGPDGDVYRKRGGIKLDEEGEGGGVAAGGDGGGGATSTTSVASDTTRDDLGYDVSFGMVRRAGYLADRKKKKNEPKPENILGKTITAESKKSRRIFVTEEQMNRILEEELGAGGATSTTSVASDTTRGDLGYDVPFLGNAKGKTDSKFMKPAMDREPGFSVERIGEKK